MSIIEDFYFGRVCPVIKKYNPDSKCAQATARCEELCVQLRKKLPKNEAELISEMYNCAIDMSVENGKEDFISGFITGMRFAAECFCNDKE